jgi:hypothetical protein
MAHDFSCIEYSLERLGSNLILIFYFVDICVIFPIYSLLFKHNFQQHYFSFQKVICYCLVVKVNFCVSSPIILQEYDPIWPFCIILSVGYGVSFQSIDVVPSLLLYNANNN